MIFYYNQIDFKKRINKLELYTPFFSCEHPLGVDILIIYLDSYIVVGKKVKEKEEMVTVNLGMLHYLLDHIYGALMHRSRISTPFFSRGWGGTKLEMLEKMIGPLWCGPFGEPSGRPERLP